jgi:hypothetical protein
MPKRTIVLIAILTLLTAILVVLAVQNEKRQVDEKADEQTQIVDQDPEKTAELTFSPNQVVLASAAATATVDVLIDSKEHFTDGVQLELLYDPEVLTNVTVSTPQDNFFGGPGDSNPLLNDIDPERGRISYGLGINPSLTSKQGTGVVAQLTFSLNPQSTAAQTAIEVMDRSMIIESTSHKNVLAVPASLNISIER